MRVRRRLFKQCLWGQKTALLTATAWIRFLTCRLINVFVCVIKDQLGGNSLKAVNLKLEPFLQASCHDPPGLYSSLAALIWISVSAAIWSFWVTSSAVCLVLPRTTIRLSSSTSEPCQETTLLEIQLWFSGILSLYIQWMKYTRMFC